MTTRRVQGVSALLKREISMLMHEMLAEEFGLVTLTDIKVTADFKEATVYITVLDKEKEEQVLGRLEEETPEYQKTLGRKLRMKFTPKIRFEIDSCHEKLANVEKLLKEIDKNGS
ncbi:ribosome-binding factor A [Candidatus Berkelbacteria bacterium RBG_13_40_8]|uniref:Ribosome-binding factor A n=1 Tax=Candidatus Berkelbacteria bacterium RBG_13_40_8 TaxID=1797467 RepID=A0A1F5DQI5_9BACT|nr:MAG: ribosome-binding factor A [Candidatus Berkelbacteria bacterium RBG_13_40_8]